MPKVATTEARAAFEVNVTRASFFLDIHEKEQKGAGAPPLAYRELPRGAVVFAIGALDAYLSEVSAEVIVRDLQVASASSEVREILKHVQSDLPTLALEVALLSDQGSRMQRLRNAVVDHFQNRVSMHGASAVSKTAMRVGARAADVWSAVQARGFTKAQADLEAWTDVRHQIVHQGKKTKVWRSQARTCIELIKAIVSAVDGFAAQHQS
jgi:hypothetical protein